MKARRHPKLGDIFAPSFGVDGVVVAINASLLSAVAASIIMIGNFVIETGTLMWDGLFDLLLGLALISLFSLVFIVPSLFLVALPLGIFIKFMKASWLAASILSSIFAVVFGWLINSTVFDNGKMTWTCVLSSLATSTIWLWLLSRTARDIQPAEIDGLVTAAP